MSIRCVFVANVANPSILKNKVCLECANTNLYISIRKVVLKKYLIKQLMII